MVERAELHVEADDVDLGLCDHCQQRKDGILVEYPATERVKDEGRVAAVKKRKRERERKRERDVETELQSCSSPKPRVLVREVVHVARSEHISLYLQPLDGHCVAGPGALPRLMAERSRNNRQESEGEGGREGG